MNWNDLPIWLTSKQVQELIQIRRLGTISDMCCEGKLPATKIGSQWRIDRDALRQQMATAVENARPTNKNLDEIQWSLGRMAALADAQAAVNEAIEVARWAQDKAK